MNDQLAVLKILVERLEEARIHYMVSGSTALNYYAQPRMTRDIDLIVELSADNVDRLYQLFSQDFYIDREVIRRAVARRGIFNLIHLELMVKADFIVRKDSDYRREEFSRRRRVEIAGMQVWLASPEDLLLSKLVWAKESRSEMQLRDARNIFAAGADLDGDYLEKLGGSAVGGGTSEGSAPMKDTPSEVEKLYREMLMRRSGEERLKMGCAMFESARTIALASIQPKSPRARQIGLFLRFYKDDFEPAAVEKILREIQRRFPDE